MTDAREIIVGLLRREFGPHADRVAIEDFFRNIEAAGLRILARDKVDPVTLEKTLVAVNEIAQRGFSAAYRSGAADCDAAIRAIGRKA